MLRLLALLYGLVCATAATAALVYFVLFVGMNNFPSAWLKEKVEVPVQTGPPADTAAENPADAAGNPEEEAPASKARPAAEEGEPAAKPEDPPADAPQTGDPGPEAEVAAAPADAPAGQDTYTQIQPTWFGKLIPRPVDDKTGDRADIALLVNLGLLLVFCLQHSLMARRSFKAVWTKIVPKPVERSTYVLFTAAALALLFWKWQPIQEQIWPAGEGQPAPWQEITARIIFALGVAFLFSAYFSSRACEMLGVKQVWDYFLGRSKEEKKFSVAWPYRIVRHPTLLGTLLVVWATPVMTLGHALLAIFFSVYIFFGIVLEERDTAAAFGDEFRQYQRRTPMLIPLTRWGKA